MLAGEAGTISALAMDYSAAANRAVNLTFTFTATFPPSSVTET
jgi:hypothetical protein